MTDQPTDRAGESDGAAGASGEQRVAMPAEAVQTPRLPFPVVGLGASAGGLEAYTEFLQALPTDTGASYVLIQHLPPDRESLLADILSRHTPLPVLQVEDGQAVEPNHVYVIRPGRTLTIRDGRLHLSEPLTSRGHGRPVDDFFRSLAEEQQQRAVAVVLSGMGTNGTAGTEAVKAVGGLAIAQDPESAKFPSMPRGLIDNNLADYILRPAEMPAAIVRYARHPYASAELAAAAVARRDQQALAEILTVLRTRTRHDFTGYRQPTLLRRIQRRMGLTQTSTVGDYARLLRQTAGEVTALSDDLLIHVTGFFRDPEAWEALRTEVIEPLVRDRPDDAPVRAWVTACATGEEAYTLGMLLLEAAEARDKRLDLKIFATDMAERALAHARAGVFPNGIESEITPERLDRFFDRDEAVYRVKKDLRDAVIFAPQNVLLDPPFSRLDIATCRNLLIYLEPETQRKVLALLHFGLRDGGALMLGSSESVGDAEGDFEPISRKHRLFRRVGPTRHDAFDLPLPQPLPADAPGRDAGRPAVFRPSVPQSATRLLLEHFAPPAVVVDAQGEIVYFHGDTGPFLNQPRGEPTRSLFALAVDAVRGPARVALQQVGGAGRPTLVRGGLIDTPDGRRRIEVGAVPLGRRPTGYTLVAFATHPDGPTPPGLAADADAARLPAELQKVRDELRSTVVELQASNEELKASNEEVSSMNEELQSTNEELETSKEELQSLNEELVSVNAQLQAKMGELEAATNDLSSLLASTDIAVLVLDHEFRIRRFTPATLDLFDLLATDVGRPLTHLRRKFDDPDLPADARRVLDRLAPAEREVRSESGRLYTRRVLPYRTGDGRIGGVVVTFVDVSALRTTDAALRQQVRQFDAVARGVPDLLCLYDAAGRLSYANPPALARCRPAPPGADGPGELDLPAGAADRVGRAVAAVLGGGGEVRAELPLAPGREFDGVFTPVLGPAGEVTGVALSARDVTDRNRAAAALQASQARYRELAANLPQGAAFVVGPDLRCQLARGAGLADAGLSPAAVEGKTLAEAFGPDTAAALEPLYRRALAGETFRTEHPIDGRHFATHGQPLRDAGGAVTAALAVSYDISDRVRAEEARRRSEERFRGLAEAVPQIVWTSRANAADYFSPRWFAYTGLTPETGLGTAWQAAVHPADLPAVLDRSAESDRTGGVFEAEYRLRRHDGAYRWHIARAERVPALGDWFGTLTDVHDLKAAEAAVRASEERQAFLLRLSDALRPLADPAAIQLQACRLLADRLAADRAYYVEINEAAGYAEVRRDAVRGDSPSLAGRYPITDFGWVLPPMRRGDLLVMPDVAASPVVPPADRGPLAAARIAAHVNAPLVRGGRLVGALCVTEPAPRAWTAAEAELVRETAERIWAATERARAEAAVRASEERLRALADAAPVLIWETDAGGLTFLNRHYLQFFGRPFDALAGMGWADLLHPDDAAGYLAAYRAAFAGQHGYECECRFRRHDGEYRWLQNTGTPHRGPDGAFLGFIGCSVDVTDRKRAEERQAFLLTLSDALRAEPGADAVANRALRMLAEHLHLDRCYVGVYRPADDRADLTHQVGNDRVPPLPDRIRLSDFPEALRVASDRTLVIDDVAAAGGLSDTDRRNISALGLRALVAPSLRAGEGSLLWAIVAVSATPRGWARDEITLAEEVTERTWAAVERAKAEAAVKASEEKYRTLFESIDEGFLVHEVIRDDTGRATDLRLLEVNPAFTRMTGLGSDLVGKLTSEFLAETERVWLDTFDRVARTGTPERVENYNRATGRWYNVHASRVGGDDRRVAVVFDDITARKRAEERQAFLLRLSDALRPLADPDEIIGAAMRLLGEGLGASRAYYAEWPPGTDYVEIRRDYATPGLPSLVGRYPIEFFRSTDQRFRDGRTWVVNDAADGTIPAAERDYCLAHGVAAWVDVPLCKDGKLQAALFLVQDAPRCWNPTEIALAEETAERAWAAVERANAEAALRASEQRQGLLVRFSDAVRGLADPAGVAEAACRLLTEQLGTERTLWVGVDSAAREYVPESAYPPADDLPRWPLDPEQPFAADHLAGRTVVYDDSDADPRIPDPARAAMAGRGLRAGVAAPVMVGGTLRAVLSTSQPAAPRRWRAEEVGFVEALAGRAWAEVERVRAEAALAASEGRFRGLAETVPQIVWSSTDEAVDYFNSRWWAYTGLDPAAGLGEAWQAVVHPADRPAAVERSARAAATGGDYEIEYRLRRHDGAYRWHIARATRVPALGRWFGTATDVHDLRVAHDALRASEGRLRAVAANLPGGAVFVVGPDLRYELADGQGLHDAGFTPAGYEGKTLAEALPPDLAAMSEANCRRALGGEPFLTEHAAGTRHFVTRGVPLRDAAGRVTHVLAVSYDITARREAEEAVRASEGRLRQVADNLPGAAVFVVDPDLRYTLAAGQGLRDAGFAPADFEGKGLDETPAADPDLHRRSYRQALAGRPFALEHEAYGRRYAVRGVPVRDAAGTVTAALAVSYEITDRVRAEADLRASEERLRLLVESVADHAIFSLDPAGVVTSWNEAAERVFGYPAGEAVGMSVDALFTPDDRAAGMPEQERATAADTGRAGDENWAVRKDGSRFWASGATSAVRDAAGRLTGFAKVVRDRTESRQAAEAVREGRERLRLATEAAQMGIWRWDVAADRHTRDANLNRLFGLPAEETTGPLADFLRVVHPDDRPAVADGFEQSVRHGHNLRLEFRVVWPDGTVRWLRDQGDVFGGGTPYLTGACVDVTELKVVEGELRAARDDLEVRVADRTRELAEAVSELRAEMTERERAETARRDLLARLDTAQEVERTRIARELHDSLGQYITGMSLGLSAARQLSAGRAVQAQLDKLFQLTDEMGREAHRIATELRPTALDDVGLENATRSLVEQWAARTGIPAEFGSRGLDGDAGRGLGSAATAVYRAVQECLTNIAKHAAATRVSVLLDRKPDGLEAIIEDDGRGFDPDAPRPPGPGGLGLLGMRERIVLAGGTLEVESAPGAGTTVYVRVPVPPLDGPPDEQAPRPAG